MFGERSHKIAGKVTTSERGVPVTKVRTVAGSGQYLSLYFIFPRQIFQPHMLIGVAPNPEGRVVPSGWINQDLFLKYIHHFKVYSHTSQESHKLLILQNHESCISA